MPATKVVLFCEADGTAPAVEWLTGLRRYRVLYFFHGTRAAIVSHGVTKEAEVADREIDLAIARKVAFTTSPDKHTYVGELK